MLLGSQFVNLSHSKLQKRKLKTSCSDFIPFFSFFPPHSVINSDIYSSFFQINNPRLVWKGSVEVKSWRNKNHLIYVFYLQRHWLQCCINKQLVLFYFIFFRYCDLFCIYSLQREDNHHSFVLFYDCCVERGRSCLRRRRFFCLEERREKLFCKGEGRVHRLFCSFSFFVGVL